MPTVTVTLEYEVAVPTQFGACPEAGGTSLAAANTVLTKYGAEASVRQFFTGFDQVAPKPSAATRVHGSWKPTSLAAITSAAVTAAVANLTAGDGVEVWHELDKKVRDGVMTRTEGIARKNQFYDVVKEVRPDLLVVNTLTGWEADPDNGTTGGNIDQWADVKADLLGLDLDGVHGWPYPGYDDEVPVAMDFVARFPAYVGWCVPEFGTSRNTANDPDGTTRASWATNLCNLYRANGPLWVMLYDYNSTTGNSFETTAELNAWRAQVDQNG